MMTQLVLQLICLLVTACGLDQSSRNVHESAVHTDIRTGVLGKHKANGIEDHGNQPPNTIGNLGNQPAIPIGDLGNQPAIPLGDLENQPAIPIGDLGNQPAFPIGNLGNQPAIPIGNLGNKPANTIGNLGNQPAIPIGNLGNKPANTIGNLGNQPANTRDNLGNQRPNTIDNLGNKPANTIDNLGNKPANTIDNLANQPPNTIDHFGNKPAKTIGNLGNQPANTRDNLGNKPPNTIYNLGNKPANTIDNLGNKPANTIGNLGNQPAKTIDNLGNQPANTMDNLGNQPLNTIGNLGNQPANTMDNLGNQPPNTIGNLGKQPANTIGDLVNQPTNTMDNLGNQPANTMDNLGNQPPNTIGNLGKQPANTIGDLVNQPTNTMDNLGNQPANTMDNLGNQPANTIGNLANQPANTIGNLGNQPANTIGNLGNQPANTIGAIQNEIITDNKAQLGVQSVIKGLAAEPKTHTRSSAQGKQTPTFTDVPIKKTGTNTGVLNVDAVDMSADGELSGQVSQQHVKSGNVTLEKGMKISRGNHDNTGGNSSDDIDSFIYPALLVSSVRNMTQIPQDITHGDGINVIINDKNEGNDVANKMSGKNLTKSFFGGKLAKGVKSVVVTVEQLASILSLLTNRTTQTMFDIQASKDITNDEMETSNLAHNISKLLKSAIFKDGEIEWKSIGSLTMTRNQSLTKWTAKNMTKIPGGVQPGERHLTSFSHNVELDSTENNISQLSQTMLANRGTKTKNLADKGKGAANLGMTISSGKIISHILQQKWSNNGLLEGESSHNVSNSLLTNVYQPHHTPTVVRKSANSKKRMENLSLSAESVKNSLQGSSLNPLTTGSHVIDLKDDNYLIQNGSRWHKTAYAVNGGQEMVIYDKTLQVENVSLTTDVLPNKLLVSSGDWVNPGWPDSDLEDKNMFQWHKHDGTVRGDRQSKINDRLMPLRNHPTSSKQNTLRDSLRNLTETGGLEINVGYLDNPTQNISHHDRIKSTMNNFSKWEIMDRIMPLGNLSTSSKQKKYPDWLRDLASRDGSDNIQRDKDYLAQHISQQNQSSTMDRSSKNSKCSADDHDCNEPCSGHLKPACSCHWTCILYKTCCEDCSGMFPPESEISNMMESSIIECSDNTYFVSSCKNDMTIRQFETIRRHMTLLVGTDDKWWLKYINGNTSYSDIIHRCEKSSSIPDPLYSAPVTDAVLGTHYRNAFCAICNKVRVINTWIGFAICESTSVNRAIMGGARDDASERSTSSTVLVLLYTTIEQITKDNSCKIIWLPKKRRAHSCGNNSTFVSVENSYSSQIDSPLTDVSHSPIARVPVLSVDPEIYKTKSYEAVNRNVTHSFDQREIPTNTCSLSISDLPSEGGIWFTIQSKTTNEETAQFEWDVKTGIDEIYMKQIMSLKISTKCDTISHVIIDGICRKKSFTIRMTMTFTFEMTGLVQGDFYQMVNKYNKLVLDIFQGPLSNTTVCAGITSHVTGASYIFSSLVVMNCATIMDYNKTESTNRLYFPVTANPTTVNGMSNHTKFVLVGMQALLAVAGAIYLPVTIEFRPCVEMESASGTELHYACNSFRNTWLVKRTVDAIFGNISLEALIAIICCALSTIGLIARLLLQRIVPFFNSYPGKVQFCLCLTLLFAYTFFLIGGVMEDGSLACTVLGVITHLAFLSALLWMNVTAFEIWRTFRHWSSQISRGRSSLIRATIYASGIPLLMITAALLLDELAPWSEYSPSYGKPSCWLNGTKAAAIFFVGPCSFISFVNVIFIVLTLRGLRSQRTTISEFRKTRNNMAITDTTIVVKIVFLVGITWLFGLLAALVENKVIWIMFTILNASLGFFISCVLVVNRRVMSAVRNRCTCFREDNTTTSGVHSTSRSSFMKQSSCSQIDLQSITEK